MEQITISAQALMEQAPKTVDLYLSEAVRSLDREFGKGYSKDHPELVGKCIEVCAVDFDTAMKRYIAQEAISKIEATNGLIQQYLDILDPPL